jgi:hypothetical protein
LGKPGLWRKKARGVDKVLKASFTSFWLKDVEFVILSSESEDQDLKTTSTKPDRTRPLWEENIGKIWIRTIFVILNSFQDPDGMPKQVRHDI